MRAIEKKFLLIRMRLLSFYNASRPILCSAAVYDADVNLRPGTVEGKLNGVKKAGRTRRGEPTTYGP